MRPPLPHALRHPDEVLHTAVDHHVAHLVAEAVDVESPALLRRKQGLLRLHREEDVVRAVRPQRGSLVRIERQMHVDPLRQFQAEQILVTCHRGLADLENRRSVLLRYAGVLNRNPITLQHGLLRVGGMRTAQKQQGRQSERTHGRSHRYHSPHVRQ